MLEFIFFLSVIEDLVIYESESTSLPQVYARGGIELEARVVGHSTVFHAESRSLVIYGGIRVDVAR